MNEATQSKELEDRLIDLSVRTIQQIQHDKAIPEPIRIQLIKSISSIGANYSEANNASSRADFRSKLFICKKEASESIYWIKIIKKLTQDSNYLNDSYKEVTEIIRIFQKAINTLGNGSSNGK